MEFKFCPQCGKKRKDHDYVCKSCGVKFNDVEENRTIHRSQLLIEKKSSKRKVGLAITGTTVGVLIVYVFYTFLLPDLKAIAVKSSRNVEESKELAVKREEKELSLLDIAGYWFDEDDQNYVSIKATGSYVGELTQYNGEETITYFFDFKNRESEKGELHFYEVSPHSDEFSFFKGNIKLVDPTEIVFQMHEDDPFKPLMRRTEQEFKKYYQLDEGEDAAKEEVNSVPTTNSEAIPFSQIEGDWKSPDQGYSMNVQFNDDKRSGLLIFNMGVEGEVPKYAFYIDTEPDSTDNNTYIIAIEQNPGEFRNIEMTPMASSVRVFMDGVETVYQRP